jgi:arabinofuranan 3-O-arabinosyltransferase
VKRTPPELEGTRFWLPFAGFAAVVVPVLLLVRPGEVLVDGQAGVLLDPRRALGDALRVWDADRALGTVTADELGTMWPFGAFHWLMDLARVPDWAAQRLWLAALLVAACGGVLFLARAWRWRPVAGGAAAYAYALSPFLATSAIDPEDLLPLAGLPWLLGLTVQALRHRGWRHPVLFGAVLATSASSDAAAALVLVAVPVAWIAHARLSSREVGRARALNTLTKLGVVSLALNAWWVLGLTVRATNGIDPSRFVSPPAIVNRVSSAPEVLRGLGRLPVYGTDATAGIARYTQEPWLLALTFLLPVAALLALGVARWRHRAFAVGLVVAATVLAVGAHPTGAPSPVGALIRALERTDTGLGLRGLQAAVVVVALGAALAVGSAVGAASEQDRRRGIGATAAVALIAVVAATPLWTGDLVPGEPGRDALVAADLVALAAALDDRDTGSRVLEVPAADVAPGAPSVGLDALLRRPHAARRAVPAGSAASTDLLRAIDDQVQRGVLAPEALAPLARLLGAGDVVVHAGAAPGAAALLEHAPGLTGTQRFGAATTAVVPEPLPAAHAHTGARVVLLSGSAAGIVDAAAAGLLDGDDLIRYSSSLTDDPDFAREHLVGDRFLVVTDTNRARAQRWTGVRDQDGFTETVDGATLTADPYDRRLSVQPNRPGTRSVLETGDVSVQATAYGPADRYRPDVRPALAADGDPSTAWMVPADLAPGQVLRISALDAVQTESVRLRQAPGGGIREVRLRVDDDAPRTVALDHRSLADPGQPVAVERPFRTLAIEILTLDDDADGDVGIAEVAMPGLPIEEVVRMPSDLLDAAGFRSTRYPLALVQTRLRDAAAGTAEEAVLHRVATLPATRTYQLSGIAHVADGAGPPQLGACRDDLVVIDDRPVPVQLQPGTGQQLRLEGCDAVTIGGGERRFRTAPATTTGVDVDQLVWRSEPVQGPGPAASTSANPALQVTSRTDTTIELDVTGYRPGNPFWVVLSQSFDDGWAIVDADAEVDGPHLVNGYATGFLVTPASGQVALQLRFVPQNRVEVGLLISAVAALIALALAVPRPVPIRPPVSAHQEPLRRLRAFTYEGALPTQRDAAVVAGVGAVGGTLLAGPAVGLVLAAVGGFATRREGWRPALSFAPALLLLGAAGASVLRQVDERLPHGVDWPAAAGVWHRVTLLAVLLLALDVVIERAWRRGSLYE